MSAADASSEGSRTRTAATELPPLQRALRWAGYAALAVAAALSRGVPRPVALGGGSALGAVVGALPSRSHRRVEQHLRLAFPGLHEDELHRLAGRVFKNLGRNMAEVLHLGAMSAEALLALVDFDGLEHLQAAQASGKGALLVTGHVGCWELMAAAICSKGLPLNVIAREAYDPRMDRILVGTRARFGVKTIQRNDEGAAREILRTLRRGEILGLLIDVDISAAGAFVPFFGKLAWTPTGAAAFSVRTGAPVVMGFIERVGARHRIRFEPPLPPVTTGVREDDLRENTARYTARIEAAIRVRPEDWIWTHRRWRRVPGPDGLACLPHKLPPATSGEPSL